MICWCKCHNGAASWLIVLLFSFFLLFLNPHFRFYLLDFSVKLVLMIILRSLLLYWRVDCVAFILRLSLDGTSVTTLLHTYKLPTWIWYAFFAGCLTFWSFRWGAWIRVAFTFWTACNNFAYRQWFWTKYIILSLQSFVM